MSSGSRPREHSQATGLFTDVAQSFLGQTGAVILELLAGLAFVALGVRDIRKIFTGEKRNSPRQ